MECWDSSFFFFFAAYGGILDCLCSKAHHFAALGFSATEVWMSQSVAKNGREDSATGPCCYPCFPEFLLMYLLSTWSENVTTWSENVTTWSENVTLRKTLSQNPLNMATHLVFGIILGADCDTCHSPKGEGWGMFDVKRVGTWTGLQWLECNMRCYLSSGDTRCLNLLRSFGRHSIQKSKYV